MKPLPPIKNVYPPDRSREAIYPATSRYGRTLWYLRQNWMEFGPFSQRREAIAYTRVPFWERALNPKGIHLLGRLR